MAATKDCQTEASAWCLQQTLLHQGLLQLCPLLLLLVLGGEVPVPRPPTRRRLRFRLALIQREMQQGTQQLLLPMLPLLLLLLSLLLLLPLLRLLTTCVQVRCRDSVALQQPVLPLLLLLLHLRAHSWKPPLYCLLRGPGPLLLEMAAAVPWA